MKPEKISRWTIITNHGLVLAHIWKKPQSSAREVASALKVTEWTVRRIVDELEAAGYIERQKIGRGNFYRVNPGVGLRHETTRHVLVGDLMGVLTIDDDSCS